MTASSKVSAAGAAAGAQRHIDLATRIFYGLGAAAYGVKENGFGYFLLLFYNQVMGLPAQAVGLAALIALLFDACIDPLIGQVSDHLRTPWGRRHPLMYASALPFALAYLALWNPPHWSGHALFWYLVGAAIVIRTFASLFEVPNWALAGEFSTGYAERSILVGYRYFFTWVGGLTINFFAYAVLLRPDRTHPVGQLNPAGYAHYGMLAAAVMFTAIIASCLGTHRQIPHLMPPPPRRRWNLMRSLGEVRETLSSRSLIFLLASNLTSNMAIGLAAALNFYINTFFWQFGAGQIAILTIGVYFAAAGALMATPALSRRFGKRGVSRVFMALAVAMQVAPLLLRLAGFAPANHTTALLVMILITGNLATAFGIIFATMNASMVADLVEPAQLRTGRRSEGLFFSIQVFVTKATSGVGIFLAATIVSGIALRPGADPAHVPAHVLRHLVLIFAPLLTFLYAAAIVLVGGYGISPRSHAETLERLAAEAKSGGGG